jgi:hypothetical protein
MAPPRWRTAAVPRPRPAAAPRPRPAAACLRLAMKRATSWRTTSSSGNNIGPTCRSEHTPLPRLPSSPPSIVHFSVLLLQVIQKIENVFMEDLYAVVG